MSDHPESATALQAARGVARRLARGAAAGGRSAGRGFRAVVNARGAGESGLGQLLDLHLVSTAADTLVVTALASTIFFAVPTEAARGRVALSLAITMIPFALLAPLIGPLLDRVPHGRRYALATTMIVRSFVSWVMAGAVAGAGDQTTVSLYLAACGFLVCQKAYLVTRAAAMPKVLPRGTELLAANSRVSLAGVVAMIVFAPVGAGLTSLAGPEWTLRLAFVAFAAGTALALLLPARVDSADPRAQADGSSTAGATTAANAAGPAAVPGILASSADTAFAVRGVPRAVRPPRGLGHRGTVALRGNAVLRAFTGFFTLFLAFRLRSDPLGGLDPGVAVALVIAVFGIGGGAGMAAGGLSRRLRPDTAVIAAAGLAAVVCGWAALAYGLWTVLIGAFVAGLAQSLAKLCLDALIQSGVAESVRSSAFARSETVLQLAWVAGGGVGLIAPLPGPWGLGLAAALTAAAVLATGLAARR